MQILRPQLFTSRSYGVVNRLLLFTCHINHCAKCDHPLLKNEKGVCVPAINRFLTPMSQ